MRYLSFYLAIGLSIVATSDLYSQAPDTLSVQGMLTDPGGVPVNDTLDITTTFYKSGVAGYTQLHSNVVIQGGIFNLAVGPVDTVRFDQPIDIGITVGTDPEISPRTPLLSAPTALSLRGLRVIPSGNADDGPTMVAGHSDNAASIGVVGATIGGGGRSGSALSNHVTANYTTIGGGRGNDADATYATVGGGSFNEASGVTATVGGGASNDATGFDGTVGGGRSNLAGGDFSTVPGGDSNDATGRFATVGGGFFNLADAIYATVAGGGSSDTLDAANTRNQANSPWSTVSGGGGNKSGDASAPDKGKAATVGGGFSNLALGAFSTVAGGMTDTASGQYATVSGGLRNVSSGSYATVGGGWANRAVSRAAVGGGVGNLATGNYSTIPGGRGNTALGEHSFAAGRRAAAVTDGAFVWADGSDDDFSSTGANQFLIRAFGGVGINTNSPDAQFHVKDDINAEGLVLSAYVAVVENTSTGQNADGLAIKIGSTQDPEYSDNFIGFFDGTGIIGSIEGNDVGGVVLATGGADYAEYMPRLDPGEAIEAGDIVGVYESGVTRQTDRATRAMVVSSGPAVLGNTPHDDQIDAFEPIAFVGQVRVRLLGPVTYGDLIIPSGRNDGTGIAISPENLSPDYTGPIIGQAWETDPNVDIKQVRVAVGLDGSSALRHQVRQQQIEIDLLRELVGQLNAAAGTN